MTINVTPDEAEYLIRMVMDMIRNNKSIKA